MNPASPHRHRITLLIFVSGAVLMALEIAGSRVLAPFFGSSVFVWGSLIGIFLGAMSGGYWLGGWLSERWPQQVLLNSLLAAAGGFTVLLPLWAAPLCHALAGGQDAVLDLGPRLGPLLAALILFALPSVLMGVASPFAVRLLARDVSGVGGVAGRLYAIGTLGSIAGTLVTAFWLIPQFGTHHILIGIGMLLMATAAATLSMRRTAAMLLAFGILLSVIALTRTPPDLRAQPARGRYTLIEERDSAYTHMTVEHHLYPTRTRGEVPIAAYLRFGKYTQGAIFINDWQRRGREHWSAAPYTDLFHLARLFNADLRRVLFIGGGVGIGPRSFRRNYPESRVDLVEIDPVVVELGRKHFFLETDDRLQVHIDDGRTFLRRHPDRQWDVIILDAFTIGGRLPFHLMTREFLEAVKAHLAPGGVLLANLNSALTGEQGRIFRAEYLTYREVFPSVYVFPRYSPWETAKASKAAWERPRNIFLAATLESAPRTKAELVASAEQLWGALGRAPHRREDTELFFLNAHAANLIDPAVMAQWLAGGDDTPIDFSGAEVLTDDFAPVDTMVFEPGQVSG